jgi:hypothetical protein
MAKRTVAGVSRRRRDKDRLVVYDTRVCVCVGAHFTHVCSGSVARLRATLPSCGLTRPQTQPACVCVCACQTVGPPCVARYDGRDLTQLLSDMADAVGHMEADHQV